MAGYKGTIIRKMLVPTDLQNNVGIAGVELSVQLFLHGNNLQFLQGKSPYIPNSTIYERELGINYA